MRSSNKWLLGGLTALLLGGLALAQTVVTQNLSGTESVLFQIGGVGGGSGATQVLNLRNGTALKTFVGLTGVQTYQALTTDSTLYWVGTAPTSWTITTPAAPFDGEILSVGSDTTLTSKLTITANTGQTMNTAISSATLCSSAPCSIEFQYSAGTTKWYELR